MKQLFLYPNSLLSPRTLPIREQTITRVLENLSGCSTVELLSVTLSCPIETATNLMVKFQSLDALAKASESELSVVPGIGPRVAARLKAALQLSYRLTREVTEAKTVTSPGDAAQIFMEMLAGKEQECLLVMSLNTRCRVIATTELYRGSVNTTHIRVSEIFREAVKRNAVSIIVAHNHPSGDPSPSPDDISTTRSLIEAGKQLQIDVQDHLIVAGNRFVSLKERGVGFN